MLLFRVCRNEKEKSATGFDMGDIEFIFGEQAISSRGNSRLSNMIYLSVVDLIDNLLRLWNGGGRYEFVGTDSSFVVKFEMHKQGVCTLHGKDKYGPIPLRELLGAIDSGIDAFLTDPRNVLPSSSSMYDDFNAARIALKKALA